MMKKLFASISMLSIVMSAQAIELVQNGSFETPTPNSSWVLASGGPYFTGSFTNWTASGAAGVWCPDLSAFLSMPHGLQAGFASDGSAAGSLTQVLSDYTIAAGDSLTFSFDIGNRRDIGPGNFYSSVSTNGTATLMTTMSNTVLATGSYSAPGGTGTWQSFSLAVGSGALSSYAGEGLKVVLSSPGGGLQGSFDRVSVQVVPEPDTMIGLGAGLVALARRKRKSRSQ